MTRCAAIVTAAFLALSSGALAQNESVPAAKPAPKTAAKPEKAEATLKVGDKAPSLSVEKWIKGEPITGFEKGKVYVVEFWATWCGPCIASMPHLTSLQKEYKEKVTIIGVSSKDTRGNTLEKAEQMVKDKADVMGYTVAWDTDRQTNAAYMTAADQHFIPTSFVVDGDGKIAFIGHPKWLDVVLDGVTKGTWHGKESADKLTGMDKQIQEIQETAVTNPKGALAKINALEKESPAAVEMVAELRDRLVVISGGPRSAELGRKLVEKAEKNKDAQTLNQIAWGIVDPKGGVENKNLEIAMLAATKAAEITNNEDAAILDTLAWVHFTKGDSAKAVELEKKAVELAPDQLKSELEESLKTFEAGKK